MQLYNAVRASLFKQDSCTVGFSSGLNEELLLTRIPDFFLNSIEKGIDRAAWFIVQLTVVIVLMAEFEAENWLQLACLPYVSIVEGSPFSQNRRLLAISEKLEGFSSGESSS